MTTTQPESTNGRYDSRADTLLHTVRVGELMVQVITELSTRSVQHDLSKTRDPEVAMFDEFTPRLAGLTYGTPEYKASLEGLRPALDHHYAANRHHPEHGDGTVNWMTLADLIEMLADWKASTERMGGTGDLRKSITINADRFAISDQLTQILINTAEHFGWIDADRTTGTVLGSDQPVRPAWVDGTGADGSASRP